MRAVGRSYLLAIATLVVVVAGVGACLGDDPDGVDDRPTSDAGDASTSNDAGGGDAPSADAPTPPPGPPGSHDSTFTAPVLPLNPGPGFWTTLAVDQQSRIYVGGSAECTNHLQVTSNRDVAVVRLTAAGAIDTTFGSQGRACVALAPDGGTQDDVSAIAIDSQGNVVVAARYNPCPTELGCVGALAVVRLTPNGQLDGSFGNSGIATAAAGGANDKYALGTSMVVDDSDQSIYVSVSGKGVAFGPPPDGYVVRFSGTGKLEAVPFDILHANSVAGFFGVARAGSVTHAVGTTEELPARVAVYSYDSTMGKEAGVALNITPKSEHGGRAAIAGGDNKLVLAAVTNTSFDAGFLGSVFGDIAVVQMAVGGSGVDTTFGDGGVAFTPLHGGSYFFSITPRVLVQKDGKVLVGGELSATGSADSPVAAAVARLNPNGSIDTGYGAAGVGRGSSQYDEVIVDVALDPKSQKAVLLAITKENQLRLYRLNP